MRHAIIIVILLINNFLCVDQETHEFPQPNILSCPHVAKTTDFYENT